MAIRSFPPRSALAQAALLLFAGPALAQSTEIQTVTVSGRSAANAATVAGFGDLPLSRSPFSATVINLSQLQDAGIQGLGDLTRLDAGTTDAYNAPGYWGQLAVRGFTLDNRFNYRRDGLPINAETVIGQANKQALEILKGTSGLQAGTSAPGGLVNLVVKRPAGALRRASLEWMQDGNLGAAFDLGDRGGPDDSVGWRVSASVDRLDPLTHDSRGHRGLLAGAGELRLGPATLVEAEFEASRQSQPSTPGFSLLGPRLPDAHAIDPRTNLNNQSWSLPVVMDGRTASLRVTQTLSEGVALVAHALRQRLDSDDRIAFPFGCSDEGDYTRYCSNGRFDLYDYRSEGERRTSDALDLSVSGRAATSGLQHRFSAGVLFTRYQARFNRQAYNGVGTGLIDGSVQRAADPTLAYDNTNRDERSTELHLQDAITLSPQWQLWAGLRQTQLQRSSVLTSGAEATRYRQSIGTPWVALANAIDSQTLAYASWGQGAESEVVPNRPTYRQPGQALPALKSRQLEVGLKQSADRLDWRLAAFDIQRPVWRDLGPCDVDASCIRLADGQARHTGLEAEAEARLGALSLRGSAMALRARRVASADASLNGLRPTNVPASSVKLQSAYNLTSVPGLALLAFVTHEGRRMVLPDNSVATPGWTRTDLAARYTQRSGTTVLVWRVGVDNLTDRRAWKEAPFQYNHAYLYPLAPRTLHASLAASF